ncbi:hypothetical protein [Williamsia deligens]|uniref:Uncharacterized protein n=1 Tax=Williamsia deligens TaxID=321325 RepID=A0ABW3GDP7_9NOCA|nr:hypothetical protein [Williamsia deligens]MCP2195828.1 hypothetical protein [Williamsia deligens]
MTRDLNGKTVRPGVLKRWAGRLGGRGGDAADAPLDDPALVLVAQSFDDAAASSSVLADSGWREADEVVVTHLVTVPAGREGEVEETAAQDGYRRVEPSAVPDDVVGAVPSGASLVALARPQLLDALHLSQERSRMAGLGARHEGTVLGWQVRQRPPR